MYRYGTKFKSPQCGRRKTMLRTSPLETRIRVSNKPIKIYRDDSGNKWVAAKNNTDYEIEIKNNSDDNVMAVISVDGVNVITGKEAVVKCKNGYVVNQHSSLIIPGWRISEDAVKAFKFLNNSQDSYAVKLGAKQENIGVIGFAFFKAKELDLTNGTVYHYYYDYCYGYRWPYYYPVTPIPYVPNPSPWWPVTIYSGSTGASSSSFTVDNTNSDHYNVVLTSSSGANTANTAYNCDVTDTANVSDSLNIEANSISNTSGVDDSTLTTNSSFDMATGKGEEIENHVEIDEEIPDSILISQDAIYYDSYENLKRKGIIRDKTNSLPKPFKNTNGFCPDL